MLLTNVACLCHTGYAKYLVNMSGALSASGIFMGSNSWSSTPALSTATRRRSHRARLTAASSFETKMVVAESK